MNSLASGIELYPSTNQSKKSYGNLFYNPATRGPLDKYLDDGLPSNPFGLEGLSYLLVSLYRARETICRPPLAMSPLHSL